MTRDHSDIDADLTPAGLHRVRLALNARHYRYDKTLDDAANLFRPTRRRGNGFTRCCKTGPASTGTNARTTAAPLRRAPYLMTADPKETTPDDQDQDNRATAD